MNCSFPAESPDDYLSVNGTLHFEAGDTEQCYCVQIVDDAFCDPGQFFSSLALTMEDHLIMIDPANAEIIIQDSDCGKLKCSTMPAISIILQVGYYSDHVISVTLQGT